VRDAVRRTADASIDRFRKRGRPALAWMFRLTAAAVASFAVADVVFPRSVPLLAPLTALLVVQLTPVSILASGIQRVVSVVAGVSVAVGFSSLVGLTWWSLGITIAVSLLIGQLLRLGPNQIEVPISAMLVLGVGAATAESAAWQRILETLVGAGVGVLSNLVFPPRVASADAATALEGLGDDVARLLEVAGQDVVRDDLTTSALADRARGWLGQARRVTHDIPNVGSALLRAEESRRLNLRAIGTADSGPGLRQGMEALEHSAVAVRNMFRSFVEAFQGYDAHDREVDAEVRAAVGLLLHDLAATLRSFGLLVRAEAAPTVAPPDLTDHQQALQRLHETRTQVSDLLLVDPRGDTTLAILTLSLLSTVDRLLQELDLDERSRQRLPPHPPRGPRLAAHPPRLRRGPTGRTHRRRHHGGEAQ
jgi:hypothetical protein